MMKRVKSDSGKKPPAFQHAPPPRREVCPICGLPGDPLEVANNVFEPTKKVACLFFSRCRRLAFGSDMERSEHFRTFHTSFCQTCREPADVCRQKKVAKVTARAKKLGSPNGNDWYLEPKEIRELADQEKCKPPNASDYTAVIPSWYKEPK